MIPLFEECTHRKVRVFISSTFDDMKKEREIIVNSIFPHLRKEFDSKLVDIMEVDLRWGIPDDNIETCNILEICIGEVLHCWPFFMGIIGDRYGTSVNEEDIDALPPAYRNAIGNELPVGVSITELEMRAGVFVKQNRDFSYFFIKDSTAHNINRDDSLKRLISQIILPNYNTFLYKNLCDFEDVFFLTLKKYIEKSIPKLSAVPYGDVEYLSHLKILQENTLHYVENTHFISVFEQLLNANRKIYLYGVKGAGKSACLSNIIFHEGVKHNNDVFFHFATAGNESANINNIFLRLRLYLLSLTDYEPHIDEDYDAVTDILSHVTLSNKTVLFFDAVELFNDPAIVYKLMSLANINNRLFIVCSGTKTYSHLPKEVTIEIPNLTNEQIRQVVLYNLNKYGKRITEHALERIISHPMCSNALFLRVLVSQLRTYGDYGSFETFFNQLLSSHNFDSLFLIIIKRIEEYFEIRKFEIDLIYQALALISYSYHGITEKELQDILNFVPVARCVFLSIIERFTIEDRGLIRFNHDLVFQATQKLLMGKNIFYEKTVSTTLIKYFSGAEGTWRKYCELPFQLNKLGLTEKLKVALLDPNCFQYLLCNEFHTLTGYMSTLLENQEEILNFFVIQPSINKILLAEVLCNSGCFYAAIKCIQFIENSFNHPDDQVQLMNIKARSLYKLGQSNFQPAIEAYKELLLSFSSLYPEDNIGYAGKAYLLGVAYKSAGKLSEANKLLSQCAKIFLDANVNTSTAAWVLDLYGQSLYESGNLSNALDVNDRALDICSLISGDYSLEMAWAYCYGWPTLYALGEKKRATDMVLSAYRIYHKHYMGRGVKLAWAALSAGTIALIEKNISKAIELYEFSIKENDAIIPAKLRPHVYSLTAYCNLASLYESEGIHSKATSIISFIENESKQKNGESHPYTANIILNAGIINFDPAKIRKAISIYKYCSNEIDTFFAEVCLSRILYAVGLIDESIAVISECSKHYFAEGRETSLIEYLIIETLEKMIGNINNKLYELSRYNDYRFYLTHCNSSNIIYIPKIARHK